MIPEKDAIDAKLAFQSPPQTIDAICGHIGKTVQWDYLFDMMREGEFRYVYACNSNESECADKPCMRTSKAFETEQINY